MSQPDAEEPALAPASPEHEHWDGRCVTCGVTQTPMWRLGPGGGKTMCNACGIRWKRAQETLPVKVEKTIKKRKKKKTELEALTSPDNNSLSPPTSQKRLRAKPSPPLPSLSHALLRAPSDDDISPDDDDQAGDEGEESVDGAEGEEDGPMAMEVDEEPPVPHPTPGAAASTGSVRTAWRPSESPFQSGGPSPTPAALPPSSHSLPTTSRSASAPTTRPAGWASSPPRGDAPFPALASSPLVHASVSVKREGKEAPSTPHGIGIDLNLLREILTRLENLRKEHKKTTEQVQYMMEECRAHPELFQPPGEPEPPSPASPHRLGGLGGRSSPLARRPLSSASSQARRPSADASSPFPLSAAGSWEEKPSSLPNQRK